MSIEAPIAKVLISILRNYVRTEHGGNQRNAATALGMNAVTGTLNKWLREEISPRLGAIGPVVDRLGVEVVLPKSPEEAEAELDQEKARLEKELAEARETIAKLQGEVAAMERMLRFQMDAMTGSRH